MRNGIEIFETTVPEQKRELNSFINRTDIVIRSIHTAAGLAVGSNYYEAHFVTVFYTTKP